jgi:hypothetical protein
MTKDEATRTAGERLEAIERWSRATFAAAVASAILLALIAGGVGYGLAEYVRFKAAVAARPPLPPRHR